MSVDRVTTREDFFRIAREEFVFTAQAFFAPIYGTWIVVSRLLKR
jgi:hypothetical protein